MAGTLYLVATPIGNLEDITLRAMRILREAAIVACEDTRTTKVLLDRHGIAVERLVSYHQHNEMRRVPELIAALDDNRCVALVSDAGTPGISDPAQRVVDAAIAAGHTVVPIPGPTAAIAALIASGLDASSFTFAGFLPHKKGRQTALRLLAVEKRTLVLYESPHRILKLLEELREHCGNRRVCVAREISKVHEEFLRGTISEVHAWLSARDSVKGEIVVIVEGAPE
jgi:16S rRNA (cytidine1402-2'-O)-methyltransferase